MALGRGKEGRWGSPGGGGGRACGALVVWEKEERGRPCHLHPHMHLHTLPACTVVVRLWPQCALKSGSTEASPNCGVPHAAPLPPSGAPFCSSPHTHLPP